MQNDRLNEYCRNSKKVFIPASIVGNVYEKNFITSNKLIILGIITVVEVLITIKMIQNISFSTFIAWLIMTYLILLILRFGVLEEKKFKKIAYEVSNNKFDGGYFNNIKGFRNNQEYTYYILANNIVCSVYKLEFESIIGKEQEDIDRHYDAISNMFKTANELGYCVKWKEVQETKNKDEFVNKLNKEIKRYEHSVKAEELLRNIIETNIVESRDRNNNILYLVLYKRENKFDYDKLNEELAFILTRLDSSLISEIIILNKNEIKEFLFKRNGIQIDSINSHSGMNSNGIKKVINSLIAVKEDNTEEKII